VLAPSGRVIQVPRQALSASRGVAHGGSPRGCRYGARCMQCRPTVTNGPARYHVLRPLTGIYQCQAVLDARLVCKCRSSLDTPACVVASVWLEKGRTAACVFVMHPALIFLSFFHVLNTARGECAQSDIPSLSTTLFLVVCSLLYLQLLGREGRLQGRRRGQLGRRNEVQGNPCAGHYLF
jgi:ferredoxin